MSYRCLIIDDELPARELIKAYLEILPDFEVVGLFDNAIDGFIYLQSNEVDLLFLDIQMPKMSGLDLLKALHKKPEVILTTAFREYAVEAFDLEIFDYLVKPVSQERFLKAISKFLHFQEITKAISPEPNAFNNAYLFLKVDKDQVKVFLNDILYIEGLKDYIKVFTSENLYVVYERLGYMEAKLPESKFIRVHKSFIVAIDKINTYNNDSLKIHQQEIPIGRMYKQVFLNKMGS
ncbi:LytTR family DNA-binding domain-containing protein [Emticicia sp. BO119]|uniref:LytR/AlgR family response regulator transcription factor n=1 Tax=Emticicia sp. BO119 TaxID=2757768 RepID=UPI0015F0C6D3|nr:LytTR family DNA-binding domain-containing protein [Emticicia sp. BO119]MBA4851790.1 response regulator transcription factor [Emticicia sp. BO119]